jgi:hypothetical protein
MATFADDKADEKKDSKSASFDKIKTLNGEWEVKPGKDDHAHHSGTIVYKLTAAGSTLLETSFGGTDHEMVTTYYVDGGKLALTHYCMLQNRPLMREKKSDDPKKIVLACMPEDNAKIADEMHMHQVTYTFVDDDHVNAEWVMYNKGKPEGTPHTMELIRKKVAAKTQTKASGQ